MSSLVEIESAVDQLPLADKEELLRYLEARLRARGDEATSVSRAGVREQWGQRLDALRASISTGQFTISAEDIISESRAERN